MSVKRFNIAKPEKYTQGDEEKTKWHSIGTLVEFQKQDGGVSRIIEIPAIGLKANVFPFKDERKEEAVDADSIPF